jgi:hypothetical protein
MFRPVWIYMLLFSALKVLSALEIPSWEIFCTKCNQIFKRKRSEGKEFVRISIFTCILGL